ncbi:hypothetical protein GIB67_001165 [Kingdonia uniflora]|uniref:phosphatidylserine decarboxylase n=1 Tax=Kingdonia uniflora TaxID=39325 RepID=A0A7J7LG61_9MAGN|nr:hypothetical protein GIB67_001165 [Kingdonia uniflora]
MRFRFPPKWTIFSQHQHHHSRFHQYRLIITSFTSRNLQARHASTKAAPGTPEGKSFLVPGATVATILMLGVLHGRRLYDDKKVCINLNVEEAMQKGVEPEFSPDTKAGFLRMLPLRPISRIWGVVTSVELPVWFRSYVYKAWARAFHSNLEEAALPLDQYASLQEFFMRTLKEGCRPIDPSPHCLASPVDGTILRFGELKESGAMIEQVKGFSYSASSLLGANTFLPPVEEDMHGEHVEEEKTKTNTSSKSWWRISWASPKVRDTTPVRYVGAIIRMYIFDPCSVPMKGVFYCVIYLTLGDYHRVHSPIDWHIFVRRHFSGRLFPVNERAARTIRNLYMENERVVLEGQWAEGFMALAAVGATNIGSIKVTCDSAGVTGCDGMLP